MSQTRLKVRRVSDGRILSVTRQLFEKSSGLELVTDSGPVVAKPKKKKKADVTT